MHDGHDSVTISGFRHQHRSADISSVARHPLGRPSRLVSAPQPHLNIKWSRPPGPTTIRSLLLLSRLHSRRSKYALIDTSPISSAVPRTTTSGRALSSPSTYGPISRLQRIHLHLLKTSKSVLAQSLFCSRWCKGMHVLNFTYLFIIVTFVVK